MLTKNIKLKSFEIKTQKKNVLNSLKNLLKDQPKFFDTLKPLYKYSYSKKIIAKYRKMSNIRIIGMGGSILGSEAIYQFLKKK